MSALIDVRALRVAFPDAAYGERLAVDGVSFQLEDGGTMALVGESGCGKTLTALAVLGLCPPAATVAAERLSVAGLDVLSSGERTLSRLRGGTVGLALQEPATALNSVRTVGSQVAEAARLHCGLDRAQARDLAIELLAEVGLEQPEAIARAYPHQLSGGQRQRALLASALSGQPKALIADEPTSALDTVTARRIVALLARLHDARGLALLLISHDLPLVAQIADRVVVIYAGETVEVAPRDTLFAWPAHPYTRALVELMPRRGRRGAAAVRSLPGQVAVPSPDTAGCRFAPRCPHVFGRCREARPALVPGDPGRWVRCFLHSSAEERDA